MRLYSVPLGIIQHHQTQLQTIELKYYNQLT